MIKTVLTSFTILCLLPTVFVVGLAFHIQPVKANGTIYIEADGSVEGTTYIVSEDNVTYIFTADIKDSIVVEKSNTIIDGKGYKLQGSGELWSCGLNLTGVNNVTIKNTNVKNFAFGISLHNSFNNTILKNNITENSVPDLPEPKGDGIYLASSNSNRLFENNIMSNECGIYLENSANNSIYHNNFIYNTVHAIRAFPDLLNAWDNGYPSGGNYWYPLYWYPYIDSNHDGTGDSPLSPGNNTDRYPLMGMFSSFNTSLGHEVNVISNSTIEDFEYFEANHTIIMHASNMSSNQTFGFIRICIPHALMNETYQVIVNGIEPSFVNYTLYDSGTHRWIYFNYQHSTLEIIIVPEFPSFVLLPLFMIATLLAVIAYKKKKSNLFNLHNVMGKTKIIALFMHANLKEKLF